MTQRAEDAEEPAAAGTAPLLEKILGMGALRLALVTLVLLLPFLGKPLHVDDPMYLWAAQHIADHPFDPYGFEVNWYGTAQPMSQVMKNPPLVCYYLAAVSLLFGWREWALHLALALPAIGVVLGVYRLARELGAQPALAALTTLLSPVFLISASTLMSDVSMLCSYVWAIAFWVRGLDRSQTLPLLVASLLIAVSTLTKYFGITLFPLLVAYALIVAPGGWRRWLPPLALPALLLVAYQLWTRELYGQGHLLEVASYATATRAAMAPPVWTRLLTTASFTGGGSVSAALVLLAGARRREIAWCARLFGAVLLVLWVLDPYPAHSVRGLSRGPLLLWIQLAGFVSATLLILAWAAGQLRRRWRDPALLLPVGWLLGTLTFAGVFNWSVNGRATLAAAPAAAILVARHVERFSGPRRLVLAGALALGGGLALLATFADSSHARAAQQAARAIHERFDDRRIWFLGHWGFQHYMQLAGARPVDGATPQMARGDLLVQPRFNSYSFRFQGKEAGALAIVHEAGFARTPFLATMELVVHAGFYTDQVGPLPFGFGRVPPDSYQVLEIRGPVRAIPNR